jgi:outer membrane protein OmpA-like peptidoglycan-associated protein
MCRVVEMTVLLLVCGSFLGCSLCDPPKPPVEVQREPFPEPQVEQPAPSPTPAAPVVVEPTPEVKPVVPPVVVAAVKDLDEKYPGLFTFDKETGLFQFKSDTTFASGSSVVQPKAKAALTKLAQILNDDQVKDRTLTIVGHTDSDRVIKPATIAHLKSLGKSADNQGLSEARAQAVAAVLLAGGIDADRMIPQGRGQTEPIGSNNNPAGKAKNRRVSVYLTPMAK